MRWCMQSRVPVLIAAADIKCFNCTLLLRGLAAAGDLLAAIWLLLHFLHLYPRSKFSNRRKQLLWMI